MNKNTIEYNDDLISVDKMRLPFYCQVFEEKDKEDKDEQKQ